MSYSYHHTFRSKRAALRHLDEDRYLPRLVKELIIINVAGIKNSDDEQLIRINADGHSCDAPGDYQTSTHKIEVEPVGLTHGGSNG